MKAVILAAGRGTRLAPYSEILPKPLMPVTVDAEGAFVPIIDHLIRQIKAAGVDGIVVVVNYLAEMIVPPSGRRVSLRRPDILRLPGEAGRKRRRLLSSPGHRPGRRRDRDRRRQLPKRRRGLPSPWPRRIARRGAACTVAVSRVKDVRKFAIIKDGALVARPWISTRNRRTKRSRGNLAKSGMMIFSASLAAADPSISLTPQGEYTTTAIIKHCIAAGLGVALHELKGGFNDIGTWPEYLGVLKRSLRD